MKFLVIYFVTFYFTSVFGGLSEFGTITSTSPGNVVFTVDDGNPIKRYCVIEMTVQDKKIKWISHPLDESYVKRNPRFLYNFNDKQMLIASTGKDKKDNITAQVHLYNKPEQTLELLAEEECTERAEIKVEDKLIEFSCGPKTKKVKLDVGLKTKVTEGFPKTPIVFKGKSYEAKSSDWRFEIAETDDYFKDRLLIIQKNQVLKEYKAPDFMRCFEYETLKGSQNKFSE